MPLPKEVRQGRAVLGKTGTVFRNVTIDNKKQDSITANITGSLSWKTGNIPR